MYKMKRRGIYAGGDLVPSLDIGQHGDVPGVILRRYFKGAHGWIREGVGDDGSCFFHTLARIINFDDYNNRSKTNKVRLGHNLRKILMHKITPETWISFWSKMNIPSSSVPSAGSVIERMSNTREWADIYMISWIMDHLNISLYFFDSTTDKVYCGARKTNHNEETMVGFVLWLNHSHFEPIMLRLSNDLKDKILSKFKPTSDHARHINNQYDNDRCHSIRLRDILA